MILAAWEALRISAREAADWDAFARATEKLAGAAPTTERAALLAQAGLASDTQLGRSDEATHRLREALRLDPTHGEAYARLHEISTASGDWNGLLDLVTQRIAVVDDADELARLFWEQAELSRALGLTEQTIEALGNLHTLEPAHAPGLALLAEAQVSVGRFDEAVQALRELACVDLPIEERRHARLAAARYLSRSSATPPAPSASSRSSRAWASPTRTARRAWRTSQSAPASTKTPFTHCRRPLHRPKAQRARGTKIRAGTLMRSALGDEAGAVEAYERALEAAPTDIDAATALSELLDRGARRRLASSFEEAVRRDLAADPTSPDHLRELRTAARLAEDLDFERLVLDAVAVVGAANEEELERWTALHEYEAPLPTGTLGDAQIAALGARVGGDPLVQLGEAGAEAALAVLGADAKSLGLGKKELVKPKDECPERDAIERIRPVFDVASDCFYRGGEPPGDVGVATTQGGPSAWMVSESVGSPMAGPHRFRAGALAMGVRQGAAALIDLTPVEATSLLAAIASAADASLAGIEADAEVTAAARKALSRTAKKSVARAAEEVAKDVDALIEQSARIRLTCAKAGLLVSGDLGAALTHVLDAPPTRDAIRENAEATELLRFWLSPAHRTLRADSSRSTSHRWSAPRTSSTEEDGSNGARGSSGPASATPRGSSVWRGWWSPCSARRRRRAPDGRRGRCARCPCRATSARRSASPPCVGSQRSDRTRGSGSPRRSSQRHAAMR